MSCNFTARFVYFSLTCGSVLKRDFICNCSCGSFQLCLSVSVASESFFNKNKLTLIVKYIRITVTSVLSLSCLQYRMSLSVCPLSLPRLFHKPSN